MDIHVKHRIIGVVVLATLVALLIPLCFTGNKKNVRKEMLINIPGSPSRPIINKTADLRKIYAEKQNQNVATLNIQSINQSSVKQQNITTMKNDYWIIQLASFTDHANADKLMKELIYKGFVAHVETEKTDKKYMYHVFVGPKMSREKAESLLKRIQKTFSLKGLVAKYKV